MADRWSARARWLALLAALVIGGALRADALSTGFYTDDYEQLAMVRGQFVLARPAWDVFWFGPRTAAERGRLLDFGFLPWWTAPDHRIAMLRPLSGALSWLDDQLFGDAAWGYHLHSFAWWGLLITAAWALLFRVLQPASAALALLLFALDEAHDVPLCWIANRSSLVAAAFGTWALLLQLRAQERARPGQLWLAALGFSCALAAGEYAFGLLAIALALAWLAPGSDLRASVRSTLVVGVPAGAYLGLRAALGHGVVSSGLYVSPGEPLRYLAIAPARWLALAGELVLGVPAQQQWGSGPWHDRVPALGVLALALAALALRWLWRRRVPELAALRWLLAGSLLSLLSAGAALPESRLLIAPALGVSAALAVFVMNALAALRQRLQWALALAVAGIVLVHGVAAAHSAFIDARGRKQRALATRGAALSAPIPRDAGALDVVLINAGDFSIASVLPWTRQLYGLPLPRSYRRLSGAFGPHVLRRLDARTVELEVIGSPRGGFAGSLYRTERQRLRPGDRVQLPGLDVQVLELRDDDVWRWVARFDRPLDSPTLLWLHAYPGGLRRLTLPPPGHELLLPRPAAAWE